jgi:lysophospholipase L1-like esterase
VLDDFTKAMQTNELLADGLHPNNEGNAVIFEIVKPKLLSMLKDA